MSIAVIPNLQRIFCGKQRSQICLNVQVRLFKYKVEPLDGLSEHNGYRGQLVEYFLSFTLYVTLQVLLKIKNKKNTFSLAMRLQWIVKQLHGAPDPHAADRYSSTTTPAFLKLSVFESFSSPTTTMR